MSTKPIISYRTEKKPLTLDGNKSIVQKKVSKTEYRNFTNKTELTDFVDTFYIPPTSDTYMEITCQCGTKYTYATKTAVPATNITCSCGRKVIQYGA